MKYKKLFAVILFCLQKMFTVSQVESHSTAQDCWIIIDNKVYDITNFLSEHPGNLLN
jgi:cytochrome b involved in lipid metabolism